MHSLHLTTSQLLTACRRLLTREEEAQIDDSIAQIRRERIAEAERKQKLGAGLVNVIREMPDATLGAQLLASQRFRTEMRKLGVPNLSLQPEETLEEALKDARKQSRIRGEYLNISMAQLVESEKKRRDQVAIIRSLRTSKRRQTRWAIGLFAAAVALAFVAGWAASGLKAGW